MGVVAGPLAALQISRPPCGPTQILSIVCVAGTLQIVLCLVELALIAIAILIVAPMQFIVTPVILDISVSDVRDKESRIIAH